MGDKRRFLLGAHSKSGMPSLRPNAVPELTGSICCAAIPPGFDCRKAFCIPFGKQNCRKQKWTAQRGPSVSKTLQAQASSAAGTATSKNLSAIGSSHSLAETMHLAALALLRLIRSQHSGCTSIFQNFKIRAGTGTGPNVRANAAACPTAPYNHTARMYALHYRSKKPQLST